jgi:hypothetical protein
VWVRGIRYVQGELRQRDRQPRAAEGSALMHEYSPAVPWAPEAAGVRVWAIMSPRPRGGRAVPEGANVAYPPHVHIMGRP